jgi:hypothetical protein
MSHLAEGVGFEPTVPLPEQRLSRPPPSSARPTLRPIIRHFPFNPVTPTYNRPPYREKQRSRPVGRVVSRSVGPRGQSGSTAVIRHLNFVGSGFAGACSKRSGGIRRPPVNRSDGVTMKGDTQACSTPENPGTYLFSESGDLKRGLECMAEWTPTGTEEWASHAASGRGLSTRIDTVSNGVDPFRGERTGGRSREWAAEWRSGEAWEGVGDGVARNLLEVLRRSAGRGGGCAHRDRWDGGWPYAVGPA